MRLSLIEKQQMVMALAPYLGNHLAELRLYGSRVNDEAKGGDIDLLLIVEDDTVADMLISQKHYVLASMKALLGDQKIDLLIVSRKTALEDSFVKMVLPTSLSLNIINNS